MRVIAGRLGGRRLKAPRGLHTRPTSDRVRESLFMALGPLDGAVVVDLFAGSGSLGIEALSRGAVRADFVEPDRAALRVLSENLRDLGLGPCSKVWALEIPRSLGRLAEVLASADVVLADPPYGGELARAMLARLGAAATLKPGARVVVEHHGKDELPERAGVLVRQRERRHGETAVSTYEARPSDRDRADEAASDRS